METQTKPRRVSIFQEVGLFDDEPCAPIPEIFLQTPILDQKTLHYARTPSVGSIQEEEEEEEKDESEAEDGTEESETDEYDQDEWTNLLTTLPLVERTSYNGRFDMLFTQNVVLISFILLLIHASMTSAPARAISFFVNGAAIESSPDFQKRATSPTDICKRFSQQSALINGTLYLYGGRATTSASQDSNTWSKLLVLESASIH